MSEMPDPAKCPDPSPAGPVFLGGDWGEVAGPITCRLGELFGKTAAQKLTFFLDPQISGISRFPRHSQASGALPRLPVVWHKQHNVLNQSPYVSPSVRLSTYPNPKADSWQPLGQPRTLFPSNQDSHQGLPRAPKDLAQFVAYLSEFCHLPRSFSHMNLPSRVSCPGFNKTNLNNSRGPTPLSLRLTCWPPGRPEKESLICYRTHTSEA